MGHNCTYMVWSKLCIFVGVEVWQKLRPNFDTSVEVWQSVGRNFDQTSTPPVSKFGRSVLDIFMEHIVKSRCRSNVDQTSTPNFDTPSVEVRSKFRPNFDQTSTRHLGVEVWSNCGFVGQNYEYILIKIVDIVWSKLWICVVQNCVCCLIKIVDII